MRIQLDNLEQQEQAIFAYNVEDIKLEITKRSSYLGKMRGDKEHADFITRMSLTEGESFLSDEMLEDAIHEVYEWLQAFGRDVEIPYEVKTDTVTGKDKVIFTLQPRNWWDRAAFGRVERYIKEALINYVLYRWLEMVKPDEAELYYKKYEDYAHNAQMGMNAENGNLERRFNTPFNTIYSGEK